MGRIPVLIGDREYATKGEAEDAVRGVLYAYQPPAVVTVPEHVLFLTDLLAMHPDAEQKIGAGVDHFEVRRNIRSPGFWVVRVDRTETDFSFIKILHVPDQGARVRVAFRRAVVDQVLAARDAAFREAEVIRCPITGEGVTVDDCHVDHFDPPFVELARRFADQEGGYEHIAVVTADGAIGTQLADAALAERWQQFHYEHAQLRVVSVRANLSLLRRGVARAP